jgi:hypothetical protein
MKILLALYDSSFNQLLLFFTSLLLLGGIGAIVSALDHHASLAKRFLVAGAIGMAGFLFLPRPDFQFDPQPKLRPAVYHPVIRCLPSEGCRKT